MRPSELASVGISPVERALYLRRVSIFGSLAPPDLALLADSTDERHFSKGERVLREGEPVRAVHFIVDGKVHVTRRGLLVGHAGPGTALGGYPLLARDPEGVGAVAETDTITLELEADVAVEILEDRFSILYQLLRETCRQLVEIQRRSPAGLLGDAAGFGRFETQSRELDLVQRILFIREVSAFRRSSISALASLARGLTECVYEPGARLWSPGDAAGWLTLVVDGTVGSIVPDGPRFESGRGTPLGALESLAGLPRWYEARTLTRVVGLQGHVEGLIDVLEDNAAIGTDLLAVMAAWLLRSLEAGGAGARERLQGFYGCDWEDGELEAAADAPDAGAAKQEPRRLT